MSVSVEIQRAVFEALRSALDTALADGEIEGSPTAPAIYDHVPQPSKPEDSARFPFVVIGDWTEIPFDADDFSGRECTVTIHSFSRYRGMLQLKNIMDTIKGALHKAELSISGEHFVDSFWEFAESMRDPDGITLHGVQRFRLTTVGS